MTTTEETSANVQATTEEKSIVEQVTDIVKQTIQSEAEASIQELVENIKNKLTEAGVDFNEQIQALVQEVVSELVKNTGETVATKIETVLETKKDQWAALALENPDEARRKLRNFWIGISGACLVLGAIIGVLI